MKALQLTLANRALATLIAALGVSLSIGGTLLLTGVPASDAAVAAQLAAQSTPIVVANRD